LPYFLDTVGWSISVHAKPGFNGEFHSLVDCDSYVLCVLWILMSTGIRNCIL
jgi:hypothetical protein